MFKAESHPHCQTLILTESLVAYVDCWTKRLNTNENVLLRASLAKVSEVKGSPVRLYGLPNKASKSSRHCTACSKAFENEWTVRAQRFDKLSLPLLTMGETMALTQTKRRRSCMTFPQMAKATSRVFAMIHCSDVPMRLPPHAFLLQHDKKRETPYFRFVMQPLLGGPVRLISVPQLIHTIGLASILILLLQS